MNMFALSRDTSIHSTMHMVRNSHRNKSSVSSTPEKIHDPATDKAHTKMLHAAIELGLFSRVEELIVEGADIEECVHQKSALVKAILCSVDTWKKEDYKHACGMKMIVILLKNNANVDFEYTNSKTTPLMIASQHGASDIVSVLIAHHADLYKCNNMHRNAFQLLESIADLCETHKKQRLHSLRILQNAMKSARKMPPC